MPFYFPFLPNQFFHYIAQRNRCVEKPKNWMTENGLLEGIETEEHIQKDKHQDELKQQERHYHSALVYGLRLLRYDLW
jgi:hypothetical protein